MARHATIIDVARLAGVSKATAARVMNGSAELVREETREKVIEAATQLGYERNAIAGSLRTAHTHMIALSIPDITNPFWPEVARGVQDGLEQQGYATVTVNTDWNGQREENYLRMVRRNRFDGLIINPAEVSDAGLKELRIPVVILGSGSRYSDFDSVGSDTEHAVEAGLAYLYEIGHRRIGLLAGHPRQTQIFARYERYVAFHRRNHLPLVRELVVETDFVEQAGFDGMTQLLNLAEPPTAVFAANDVLAIGALKAAQRLGRRVPDDVSIMGMDDIHASDTTSPALSTLAKPKYDIGRKAAEMLLRRLGGDTVAPVEHAQLPCRLLTRGSTAPPKIASAGG